MDEYQKSEIERAATVRKIQQQNYRSPTVPPNAPGRNPRVQPHDGELIRRTSAAVSSPRPLAPATPAPKQKQQGGKSSADRYHPSPSLGKR
jgi:hypothetical protein